ncbi:MAG: HAD family hydrolase [Dehalobacterium sp.]|jgi:phosphoglycolate phosphatase
MALILWDYDGVLVDSMALEEKYYFPACQEAGIEQINTWEDIVNLCQGNYYEECAKVGIEMEKLDTALSIFQKRIDELGCQIPVVEGMPEIMAHMAQRFPSYIITSNSATTVAETLKKHNISGIREILGFEFAKSKVEKIAYVKALFPAEKTYFIGDTSGDIFEAKSSGVDVTIGVTWGCHTVATLKKAGPDYIFNTVSELGKFLSFVEREER